MTEWQDTIVSRTWYTYTMHYYSVLWCHILLVVHAGRPPDLSRDTDCVRITSY